MQPDNHVVQKFDTRKIYKLSNEVFFSPPVLSVSPFLLLNLARRQSYAYAIGLYTRTEIKKLTGCLILCSCAVRFAAVLFTVHIQHRAGSVGGRPRGFGALNSSPHS